MSLLDEDESLVKLNNESTIVISELETVRLIFKKLGIERIGMVGDPKLLVMHEEQLSKLTPE